MELRAQANITEMYRTNALGGAERFFKGIWNFLEMSGRAIAASELARQGNIEAAKRILIKERF